ncbi:hypothetical protein PMNALOAF_0462 [Methylobacterium adhaesivum]|nr:hypothetical protein PMNALOAF_0462 [Methylobacterium adhaesivum]
MLVHWDHSADELIASDPDDIDALILELIRVRRLGYHLVSISRRTTQWLLGERANSSFVSTQLGMFHREYTQTGNLRLNSSVYIEVASFKHDFEIQQGAKIQASIKFLFRSGLLEAPKLILENIDNDGWFAEFIISNVRGLRQFPAVMVQRLHGGGGDVIRVLNYEIEKKSIVCVLMDSDKKFPDQEDDKKVVAVRDACSSSGWPFGFVFVAPCHELENLLPFSVVSDMARYDSAAAIKSLEIIAEREKLNKVPDQEIYWRWFDVKKGYNDSIKKDISIDAVNWHDDKLNEAFGETAPAIAGFGDALIPRISIDNRLQAKLAQSLNTKEWHNDFREFFGHLAWVFAAQRRTIT